MGMQRTSRRIGWAAAAIVAPVALGLTTVAGGQSRTVPPPAVDSPNVCLGETGSRSWCGDDGPADRAKLAAPSDVALAEDGSLLIADAVNNVVRRVRSDGTIVSIGGTGAEGSMGVRVGAADKIGFDTPGAVAAAGEGGVLVADTGHDAIRLISAKGTVTTLVGRSGSIRADLKAPGDVIALADGGYLISDTGHHRVLRVTSPDVVQVVAGSGHPGYSGDGGAAPAARLNRPTQVSASPDGSVLIADTGNGAVRRVLPSGVIETVTRDLSKPEGVLGLPDGGVIVSSAEGLHRVEPDGSRRRIAGGMQRGYNGDRGQALDLLFNGVGQIAAGAGGRILFAERASDRIRALGPTGAVQTVAGSGTPMPEPKADIAVGAFPPELTETAAAGNARGSEARSLARAADASACEYYNSRFATFSLQPTTATTLKVKRQQGKGGLRQVILRFASSRRAKVVIVVTRKGASVPVGTTKPRAFNPKRRIRLKVLGRFAKRTYVAKLYGISGGIRRCDAKYVRMG
jgi:hypothetical protein